MSWARWFAHTIFPVGSMTRMESRDMRFKGHRTHVPRRGQQGFSLLRGGGRSGGRRRAAPLVGLHQEIEEEVLERMLVRRRLLLPEVGEDVDDPASRHRLPVLRELRA